MSVEINALVAEFQQQITVLSSRAAQYAARLAVATAERDALKKEQEHLNAAPKTET